MSKLVRSLEYAPGAIFLMMAGFIAARLAIGTFPSDALAWQAYLTLAPAWREIAVFMPTEISSAVILMLGLLCLAAWSIVGMRQLDWPRSRFVTNHLALLAIIFGMMDERVFSASVGHASPVSMWLIPDFSQASPLMVGLLALTFLTCFHTHRAIIWGLRHPVRQVQ